MELQANNFTYLLDIILKNEELLETMYDFQLYDDDGAFNIFANKLSDEVIKPENSKLIFSGKIANEIYDEEKEKFDKNNNYRESSFMRTVIEIPIKESFDLVRASDYNWEKNKELYVDIMKAILHGYTSNFFFSNRDKFLPEYDWFLINSDKKRKTFMESLFREFDRFSYVVSSISNFVDIDEIPENKIAYLSNILGFSMNKYLDIINDKKIRTIVKNIIEVYNTKGSIYSLELFFDCLGVDIEIKELYFDRRLFFYSETLFDKTNKDTLSNNISEFSYYLTQDNPYTTIYDFKKGEIVDKIDLGNTMSESIWNERYKKLISKTETEEEKRDAILELLGYKEGDIEPFKYFKTNGVSLNLSKYSNIEKNTYMTQTEISVFKEMIAKFFPVFIKKYYPYLKILGTIFSEPLNLGFLRDSNKLYDRPYSNNSNISEINQKKEISGDKLTNEKGDLPFEVLSEKTIIHSLDNELEVDFLTVKSGDRYTPTFGNENGNFLFEEVFMADSELIASYIDGKYIIEYYDSQNMIETIQLTDL